MSTAAVAESSAASLGSLRERTEVARSAIYGERGGEASSTTFSHASDRSFRREYNMVPPPKEAALKREAQYDFTPLSYEPCPSQRRVNW